MKGWYCVDDQKDLADAELKDGNCTTCGKKPVRTDYCSKTAPGEKVADRARITFTCITCSAAADFEKDFKHEEGCKKKQMKKVCSKSGTPPHQTIPK